MTNNPFTERYKNLADSELFEIINEQNSYQPLAVEAARMEIESRQLTSEQVSEANAKLDIKQKAKDESKQKIKDIEDRVKLAGLTLVDNLHPIQRDKKSASYINLVCLSLSVIFLLQAKDAVEMLVFFFTDSISYKRDVFELLFLTVPVIYLAVTIFLFWKRKRIGWILLALYAVFALFMVISTFIMDMQTGPSPLDKFIPHTNTEIYFAQLLLFGGLFLFLLRKSIREIYSIKLPELKE